MRRALLAVAMVSTAAWAAVAGTTVFFNPAQVAALVATGTVSDTISCEGYLFTYTRDKLFTGGVGLTNPVGRAVRIPWPQGVEAQAVTSGPVPGGARVTVRRVDGGVFDLVAFTARLLANAGAGRAIEIVPELGGEEPLNNPYYFDVTGYYGSQFSYDTSANYLGSTAALTNYDAYRINLSLDYALVALTLRTATPDTNHAPTDIALSGASVAENEPPGTFVGMLTTVDPDPGDTASYALVPGAGSADNGSFSLLGGDPLTGAAFNYEARSNYSIRVQSTDLGGLATQAVFGIAVADVDETPVILDVDASGGSNVVLRWVGITNHVYAVHGATNLQHGFSVLESNIVADPVMNSHTDTVRGVPAKFWRITTEP